MKIDFVRPDDLLNLRIEAVNLRLDSDNPEKPALVVEDSSKSAYLIVTFPPQTIAEGAYFEFSVVKPADAGSKRLDPDAKKTANDSEPLDMPGQLDQSGKANPTRLTNAQLGHPSRLVFDVPVDSRIPFTIEGLLDWSTFELSINPIAAIGPTPTADQIANAPAIQQPAQNETAIELPYRLVISPNREAAWKHRNVPFTSRGRSELWHTRLAQKVPVTPKTPDGIAELSRDQPAPLRAIWSLDYNTNQIPPPNQPDPLARTAMSANDRYQIVILTSAFHGYEIDIDFSPYTLAPNSAIRFASKRFKRTVPYVPQPFNVEQLILSPLGGWLHSRGHWTPPRTALPVSPLQTDMNKLFKLLEFQLPRSLDRPAAPTLDVRGQFAISAGLSNLPVLPSLDLSEWAHIATQGRDHYVRIVYEGELWPFRHQAALIKVTERKFKENNGIIGAYLMQRMFIVVREPEKTFAKDDRGNPLKRVRLTTLVTPDIAPPKIIPEMETDPNKKTNRSFWVEVMTGVTTCDLFRFHAVGTDISGNLIDFSIPLMFVSISDVNDTGKLKLVAKEYNDQKNISNRNLSVPGQKVMFAEPDSDPTKRNDNTQLVTQTLNFIVDAAGNPPQMLKAEVKIPQVQELLGSDAPTTIRFFKKYVSGDFDASTGVFAEIVKEDISQFKTDDPFAAMVPDTLGVNFSADKAGGFATPNLSVSMLTRALGPLAGRVEDAITGSFDPSQFFPKNGAKLFGTFDLMVLLPKSTLDKNAPKLSTQTKDIAGGKLLTATLDWEPDVQNFPLGNPPEGIATFEKDYKDGKSMPGASKLAIHGTIEKFIKPDNLGGPPNDGVKSEFTGKLTFFRIGVLDSVFINFTEFNFVMRSRQKPDVNVKLDPAKPLEFGGDLKFIEELRKAIPPDLFGKGPSLDISPTGIRAGFAFALPPVAVGVFMLTDVSLGAALTLPFLDGKPVFDFNVSERPHPFLLTVSLFGGGGFFHLQLDTAGMKELEVALEFGAAAAIDIGVASGEVHIMAGIYFSLQRKENTVELTAVLSGYLRLGGSLCVLGLIKVSVEFNLSFTYDSGRDKAYGRATLTVEVDVAFFSKSVELTVERAFGGSGDPKFGDLFTKPEMWSDYALAFA